MCYSVLQCVAMCCSVLLCVAVCCSMLQRVTLPTRTAPTTLRSALPPAVCCSVLHCVAVYCSVLRCVVVCVAVCSIKLQCVAVCCSVLQCVAVWYIANEACSQHASTLASTCSVLQCVAVCCSLWQCVALRCRVLQCAAGCYSANETCSHHASICAPTCSSLMSYTCHVCHEPMVRDIHYNCTTWESRTYIHGHYTKIEFVTYIPSSWHTFQVSLMYIHRHSQVVSEMCVTNLSRTCVCEFTLCHYSVREYRSTSLAMCVTNLSRTCHELVISSLVDLYSHTLQSKCHESSVYMYGLHNPNVTNSMQMSPTLPRRFVIEFVTFRR